MRTRKTTKQRCVPFILVRFFCCCGVCFCAGASFNSFALLSPFFSCSISAAPALYLIFKFLTSLFKRGCFFTSFLVVGMILVVFQCVASLFVGTCLCFTGAVLFLITNVAMTLLWSPPVWIMSMAATQGPYFNFKVVELFLNIFWCSVRVLFFRRLSVHCVERNLLLHHQPLPQPITLFVKLFDCAWSHKDALDICARPCSSWVFVCLSMVLDNFST